MTGCGTQLMRKVGGFGNGWLLDDILSAFLASSRRFYWLISYHINSKFHISLSLAQALITA